MLNGKTVVGCDTLLTTDTEKIKSANFSKIIRFDNFLIGCAGTSTIFYVVSEFKKHHKAKKAPKTNESCYKLLRPIFQQYKEILESLLTFDKRNEDGASILLATKDKIFVCDEFSCEQFTTYGAIGSGSRYALGSLHSNYPNDDCVLDALEASCYHDTCSGKPTIIEEL